MDGVAEQLLRNAKRSRRLGAKEGHTDRGSEPFLSDLHPVFDDRCCARVDPDGSAPVALAVQDRDGTDVQVDVLAFKIEGFAHPES